MKVNLINECEIIQLPKIGNNRGNISFIEGDKHIPFSIKRVFYIYDIPGGEKRGGHAHKNCMQFIIALGGSFDVIIKDGNNSSRIFLNRSNYGLFLPNMIWRELENFTSGAICMVLASEKYNKNDYIYDYKTFSKYRNGINI
ncbi:FdtA/QdtA family cupin domain-containing protein [Candidatus Neomarinimicrobiota bacterium]